MKFAAAAYGQMLAALKMRKKFWSWIAGSSSADPSVSLSSSSTSSFSGTSSLPPSSSFPSFSTVQSSPAPNSVSAPENGSPSLPTLNSSQSFEGLANIAPTRNRPVIFEHTGIKPQDLVCSWWGSIGRGGAEYLPGHFLCVDHLSKSVVLAIRGSSNFRDALTDMVGAYEPYQGGLVHRGMLHCTFSLWKRIEADLFRTLETFPYYRFVVCGHSLGGGVTSLFALKFREEFPERTMHAFAYASPCTMNGELSMKSRKFITTFVNGDDAVPRTSIGSLEELKVTMNQLLENCGPSFRDRLLLASKYALGVSDQNSARIAKFFRASSKTVNLAKNVELDLNQLAELDTHKLYPPGLVLQFHNSSKAVKGEIGHFSEYGHVVISKTMFSDHLPHVYEKSLKALSDSSYKLTKKYGLWLYKRGLISSSVIAYSNPILGKKSCQQHRLADVQSPPTASTLPNDDILLSHYSELVKMLPSKTLERIIHSSANRKFRLRKCHRWDPHRPFIEISEIEEQLSGREECRVSSSSSSSSIIPPSVSAVDCHQESLSKESKSPLSDGISQVCDLDILQSNTGPFNAVHSSNLLTRSWKEPGEGEQEKEKEKEEVGEDEDDDFDEDGDLGGNATVLPPLKENVDIVEIGGSEALKKLQLLSSFHLQFMKEKEELLSVRNLLDQRQAVLDGKEAELNRRETELLQLEVQLQQREQELQKIKSGLAHCE